ncbi:MAG: hypothetical protein A3J72_00570 [Nitrospirae bacterium RIFCSPHIGHO2_02_FULL_40_19]|nr:MAG: hypothetical protein A3J72_00570 [Nitrospirae bacterium RIFCSPHIGHO2_02_FULL_40_19]
MSIVKKEIKPKNGSTLSPSKINILRWVREGKTNEEIGKIIEKTKRKGSKVESLNPYAKEGLMAEKRNISKR